MKPDFAGLPGHRRFLDALDRTLHRHDPRKLVAVVLCRVPQLHKLKVSHGYEQTDGLIRQLGERMLGVLRENDCIERIEDGCFALILPDLHASAHAELAAHGILQSCRAPFLVRDTSVALKVDIGVAMYPTDADSSVDLLRCAELAVDNATESPSGYSVYAPALSPVREVLQGFELENELQQAIPNGELHLCFQPKVSLRTGVLSGAEALLRWTRANGQRVPPDVFIPLAEKSGLIVPITLWTLNTALRACGDLFERHAEFSVAVNLSPVALTDPEIFPLVSQAVDTWCSERRKLVLEITESALFKDPVMALSTLDKFHGDGIRLSIDDFGTGYSSLSQLGRLRVGELKIDRSFVSHVTSIERNAQIVRSVIDLAHNFGMTVVAEGIEDHETLDFLAAAGCDYGQGYYIAHPMDITTFDDWCTARAEDTVPS